MSIWVLMFIAAVLVGVGAMVMQAFPSYVEYQAVRKAVLRASSGSSVVEVRNLFDRSAQVDNITSITGKDLEVTKQGDRVVVSFAYTKEFQMFGPAWLLMKYAGNSNEK